MKRIVVNVELREQFRNFGERIELCDTSGHVLARVCPVFDPALYEDLDSPLSRDDIERRKREKGTCYATSQVLEYLKSL